MLRPELFERALKREPDRALHYGSLRAGCLGAIDTALKSCARIGLT